MVDKVPRNGYLPIHIMKTKNSLQLGIGAVVMSTLTVFAIMQGTARNPIPPLAINGEASGNDHAVHVGFHSRNSGPVAKEYEARLVDHPQSKCKTDATPKSQWYAGSNMCDIAATNYEFETVEVRALNADGHSPWKTLKPVFVADINITSCMDVLASWEVKLAMALDLGQGDFVLGEMMNQGLYGYGSTSTGRLAGAWILSHAIKDYRAGHGGPPNTTNNRDLALQCEQLGAKRGLMFNYSPATPK